MKRMITLAVLLVGLFLTACGHSNVDIIGGADGPTGIIVSEKKSEYAAKKYFRKNYVNEGFLPRLDIDIENPFVSDDRILILEDAIQNELEFMVYEYYHSRMSGNYSKAKDFLAGDTLLAATENEEKQFHEGIYFNKIILDEIDVVDKEDLNGISNKNKYKIMEQLNHLEMTEFAIVEVEQTIKLNEKYLSMGPQIGDGDATRYYLLGKKDNAYKIVEVYWEGFIKD